MTSISNELEEKILALKKKPEPAPVPEQESATPTETEVVEQVAATTNDEQPEPDKEETQVEQVTSWDEPETKVTEQVQDDFSWVSDQLGEVKTKDEFKTKVSELKSKLKEFEDKPLEGVPDQLKEIVKVAKLGNWDEAKELLAAEMVDYSKFDPIVEYDNEFYRRAQTNPKYFTDGKFDPAKVEEALDATPDPIREMQGIQILDAKAAKQAQRKAAIIQQVEAKRQAAETALAQSTRNLGEILPLETYGIKFEQRHSSEIYEGITSSKLTKKHLGMTYEDLVRSGADMKAITRSITLAEKGEKMIAFKADKKGTEVKKEILNKTQNVQLNTPGTKPNPEDPEKKVESVPDKVKKFLEASRKGL